MYAFPYTTAQDCPKYTFYTVSLPYFAYIIDSTSPNHRRELVHRK